MHVALTIAASDSGGGSGLQGDLKTFEALGVYGATAVTAVLARNTTGITAIHDLPAAVVRDQVRAVLSDLPPGAIKVGMLSTIPVIRAIAAELRRTPAPVVLDPVMISRDGARLLRATSVSSLIKDLLPRASIVTPNAPHAPFRLSDRRPFSSKAGMAKARAWWTASSMAAPGTSSRPRASRHATRMAPAALSHPRSRLGSPAARPSPRPSKKP